MTRKNNTSTPVDSPTAVGAHLDNGEIAYLADALTTRGVAAHMTMDKANPKRTKISLTVPAEEFPQALAIMNELLPNETKETEPCQYHSYRWKTFALPILALVLGMRIGHSLESGFALPICLGWTFAIVTMVLGKECKTQSRHRGDCSTRTANS